MIVSGDTHVQVAIRRGARLFDTIGAEYKPEIMLPAGDYELEVVNGAPETRGFTARLSLVRGDRKVVEVRLEGIFVRDGAAGLPPPPPFGGPRRPE